MPLVSHQVIVQLIGSTTTDTGLKGNVPLSVETCLTAIAQ
jgi:hypothetical protein